EGGLGDDVDGVFVLEADLEAAAREAQLCFEGLVGVGISAQDEELPGPALLLEGFSEELRRARLVKEHSLEIGPCAIAEVLVGWSRVTIGAAVQAAAVRVEAEAEGEIGTSILADDTAAHVLDELDLLVRRLSLVVVDREALEAARRVRQGEGPRHGE